MPEKEYPRAYVKMNGKWRHVYVVDRTIQETILGGEEELATVKLTKSSKETYQVPAADLEHQKPRRARV